jgi:O-antigen ligase
MEQVPRAYRLMPAAMPPAMLASAVLLDGGTPRLPTFLLHLGLALLAAWVLRHPRLLAAASPSVLETSLWGLVLVGAVHLPLVPSYQSAERAFLFLLLAALLLSLLLRLEQAALSSTLEAIRVLAALESLIALWQAATGTVRVQGTFDNPNFLAAFLTLGACLHLADALGFPQLGPRRWGGRALPAAAVSWAAFLLCLVAILWTRSRGGLAAVVISLALLLPLRFGRRVLLLLPALLLAVLLVPNPFRERLRTMGGRDVYAYSRVGMWRAALTMLRDHPWTGVGLGQYQYVSPRYAFPVEGHWARYAKVTDNPHSEPLLAAAEMGLPGVILLCGIAAGILLPARRHRGQGRPPAGLWPLAAAAGPVLQTTYDFSLHSPPVTISLLALYATWLRLPPGEEAPPPSPPARLPRLRPLILLLPLYLWLAFRPLAGFVLFLRAGGGPVDLLDEKRSLALFGSGGRIPDRGQLERAAAWDPTAAAYRIALGSLGVKRYESTGDPEALSLAFRELETAMALNPGTFTYRAHAADLLHSLFRRRPQRRDLLDEAIVQQREAVRLAPSNPFLRERLGVFLGERGQTEEAGAQLERALELEPCFLRARHRLGLLRESSGKKGEALAVYRETLQRQEECRRHVPQEDYERSLLDLEPSLIRASIARVETP